MWSFGGDKSGIDRRSTPDKVFYLRVGTRCGHHDQKVEGAHACRPAGKPIATTDIRSYLGPTSLDALVAATPIRLKLVIVLQNGKRMPVVAAASACWMEHNLHISLSLNPGKLGRRQE